MLYYTCPHCGANLDPGEKCDCEEQDGQHLTEPERSEPNDRPDNAKNI